MSVQDKGAYRDGKKEGKKERTQRQKKRGEGEEMKVRVRHPACYTPEHPFVSAVIC